MKTYSEMMQLGSFEERFRYLSLGGDVGEATFGAERFMNQQFYRSVEWRQTRLRAIARDYSCDLASEGYDLHAHIIIHHIRPMTIEHIRRRDPMILDLENLVTTTHTTHNQIHYGVDGAPAPMQVVERRPGDTKLW